MARGKKILLNPSGEERRAGRENLNSDKKLRPFLEMRAKIQLGNDRVIESEDLRD